MKSNVADTAPFWSQSVDQLQAELGSGDQGLSAAEAQLRFEQSAGDAIGRHRRLSTLALLVSQFKSPIILVLVAASVISWWLGDAVDGEVLLVILAISALLGFWQELGAGRAMDCLLARVKITANVTRDGAVVAVPVEQVVRGDVVTLSAGSQVPGDCRVLRSCDLFVDEAALTGESAPVEKVAGDLPADTPMSARTNELFLGTHVVSGTATVLVVAIGKQTEFGRISQRLAQRPPQTEFERGVFRFGYFLVEVTLLLVVGIFAINVFLHRPILDSFMFSLALAVGLTPQLLPAIISVNLAHGARRMAHEKVIVRRLAAIENFGSMDVLCSDKTGTLTEGVIEVQSTLDAEGNESPRILEYAFLNAKFESGFENPIDTALRQLPQSTDGHAKLDEVPYDFVRKRLSVLVSSPQGNLLLAKGAVPKVLEVCTTASIGDRVVPIAQVHAAVDQQVLELGRQGLRAVAVAFRKLDRVPEQIRSCETEMTFAGLLVLRDPPKQGVGKVIEQLGQMGVRLKIISGDSRQVTAYIGNSVQLSGESIITGSEMRTMSDDALARRAESVDLFAEIEPNQKERIVLALKKSGHVVGYLGDGINDATAMHAADVGISVDSAVDVARDAADIVLLEHDLAVLLRGVREGRSTFANTLKYVYMATSANFGNMASMAGVSLFTPFLPLLPKQILLMNLLTDLPEMAIASDSVDAELVARPRRWNISEIRRFMLVFGGLSSLFDFLTFGVLLLVLDCSPEEFRTGWFLESVISATLIVLVIRSRRPFFSSQPSRTLLAATLLVVVGTLLMPWTGVAKVFGFVPPSFRLIAAVGILVATYVLAAELVKRWFYRSSAEQ